MSTPKLIRTRLSGKTSQRGVAVIIALILSIIFMLAIIGIVRNTDSSAIQASALAFKRDLLNQATRGQFAAYSSLATVSDRHTSTNTKNYSAVLLVTDSNGIPSVMLNTTSFDTTYTAGNISVAGGNIVVRYLIERACYLTGIGHPVNDVNCLIAPNNLSDPRNSGDFIVSASGKSGQSGSGGTSNNGGRYENLFYRVTVRVDGPRNMVIYQQSSVLGSKDPCVNC